MLKHSKEFTAIYNELDRSRSHFYVTGKAGTGKSTLLNHFRVSTRKRVIVLAPTGLAALRVRGQTIHSFFRFRPGIIDPTHIEEVPRKALYRKLDTIIIDEVSMVRADLLDGIDAFLRKNGKNPGLPFGGVQMIFFGDLFQLPPVITDHDRSILQNRYHTLHFFGARCMEKLEFVQRELTHIYRQNDHTFISILNHLREGKCDDTYIAPLHRRVRPVPDDFDGVRLVPTNHLAATVNKRHLSALPGDMYSFATVVEGDFTGTLPIDEVLHLKKGAVVIFTRNDPDERWVNGTRGIIESCERASITVRIVEQGIPTRVKVHPSTWERITYYYDPAKDALAARISGRITQFPLRLAWAMTIHKSQGQTFDKVHIDMGQGMFAHGQLYVALSRCRSLQGTSLSRKITWKDLHLDREVVEFHRNMR